MCFYFSTLIFIFTGPLWVPKEKQCKDGKTRYYVDYEVIGNPPNIAVPTHFFKVSEIKEEKKGKKQKERLE